MVKAELVQYSSYESVNKLMKLCQHEGTALIS